MRERECECVCVREGERESVYVNKAKCVSSRVAIWPFFKPLAKNELLWPFGHFWP